MNLIALPAFADNFTDNFVEHTIPMLDDVRPAVTSAVPELAPALAPTSVRPDAPQPELAAILVTGHRSGRGSNMPAQHARRPRKHHIR